MSPSFRVASFNVNGIRARLPVLLSWLQKEAPEVVCLQCSLYGVAGRRTNKL